MTWPQVLPYAACITKGKHKECKQHPERDQCEKCLEDEIQCNRQIWKGWLEWLDRERESVLVHTLAFNNYTRNGALHAKDAQWNDLADRLRDISTPNRLFDDEKYECLKQPWFELRSQNSRSMAY